MKKSELISAIKTILAENKKQKLNEDTIRQIIREVLSEEAYDTVRDVKAALGHNPSRDAVEQYLGRTLNPYEDDDVEIMKAFGFDTRIPVGRRNGQPIYASQKPRRSPTYTRRRRYY